MGISLDPQDRWSTAPRIYRLWAGLLLAPLAWAAHLTLVYAMSSAVCSPPVLWPFFLASAAALATAIAGGWIAWGVWKRSEYEPEEAPTSRARGRFMTLGGMLLTGLFAVAIVAQTIPMFVLVPCQY